MFVCVNVYAQIYKYDLFILDAENALKNYRYGYSIEKFEQAIAFDSARGVLPLVSYFM